VESDAFGATLGLAFGDGFVDGDALGVGDADGSGSGGSAESSVADFFFVFASSNSGGAQTQQQNNTRPTIGRNASMFKVTHNESRENAYRQPQRVNSDASRAFFRRAIESSKNLVFVRRV